MSVAELSGYLAAALVFLTFYMKTMIPLRIIGICSNCAFIAYGYLDALHPVLILHLILLPLNTLRLSQMFQLSREVREAARRDMNMDWIKPFSSRRHTQAGEVLFKKGESATEMFVVLTGRYRLVETDIKIESPHVVGEFGLLSPDRRRTQTLECLQAGTLLQVGYGQVEQLFFQNPTFGFYFLKLITGRLFENNNRLERTLADRNQELLDLRQRIVG